MSQQSEQPTGGPPDRGSLGLLRDRVFGPYFAAFAAAATGVWVYNVVAAVVVFDLTGSALMVGAVSVAQFLPQMLLGPWAGARADRGDRARHVLVGRLVSGGAGVLLAVWLATLGPDALGGAVPVVVASLLVGIGFAISTPAMMALLPALVRPSELGSATALYQMPHTLARSVGPAVGAMLLVVSGPVLAFALAGVANAAHGLVAARVRLRPRPREAGVDGSVRAGFRHVRTDPVCALLLAAIATIGLALDPMITLMPPLAAALGGGDQLVGLLVAAFGAGSTVTVLVIAPLRRRVALPRLGPVGLGLFAAGYLAVAVTPPTPLTLASLGVAGMGMMLAITAQSTMLQERLPEQFRGRMMALWSVAYLGSRPLAAVLNGAVADLVNVGAAFALMAAVLVAGMLIVRPRRITGRQVDFGI